MTKTLNYHDDIELLADEAAGNWRKFESFGWHRAHELDDPDAWCIVNTHHRDSDLADQSNAAAIEKEMERFMDGPHPTVMAEHANHWAVGWVNGYAIKVRTKKGKVTRAFQKWVELQQALEDYPLLDEEDHSRREREAYEEGWDSYGYKDFVRELRKEFELSDRAYDLLDEATLDETREFYESLRTSGEYYTAEGSGVSIRIDQAVADCTRAQLRRFLRKLRRKNNGSD